MVEVDERLRVRVPETLGEAVADPGLAVPVGVLSDREGLVLGVPGDGVAVGVNERLEVRVLGLYERVVLRVEGVNPEGVKDEGVGPVRVQVGDAVGVRHVETVGVVVTDMEADVKVRVGDFTEVAVGVSVGGDGVQLMVSVGGGVGVRLHVGLLVRVTVGVRVWVLEKVTVGLRVQVGLKEWLTEAVHEAETEGVVVAEAAGVWVDVAEAENVRDREEEAVKVDVASGVQVWEGVGGEGVREEQVGVGVKDCDWGVGDHVVVALQEGVVVVLRDGLRDQEELAVGDAEQVQEAAAEVERVFVGDRSEALMVRDDAVGVALGVAGKEREAEGLGLRRLGVAEREREEREGETGVGV